MLLKRRGRAHQKHELELELELELSIKRERSRTKHAPSESQHSTRGPGVITFLPVRLKFKQNHTTSRRAAALERRAAALEARDQMQRLRFRQGQRSPHPGSSISRSASSFPKGGCGLVGASALGEARWGGS
jgi:hypothetical protein